MTDPAEELRRLYPPLLTTAQRREEVRVRVAGLQRELDAYREIVRKEPDSTATVGRWLAEATREKRRLEALLGQPVTRLTKDDVKSLVTSLKDITAALAAADPADKAAAYAEMGVAVTYHADGRVLLESRPGVVSNGVGGGT